MRPFTKNFIKSIIILVFSATVDKRVEKGELPDQLNKLNEKDTESGFYWALAAPPPLLVIPSIPAIEQPNNELVVTSVAATGVSAAGTNTNVDTMNNDP